MDKDQVQIHYKNANLSRTSPNFNLKNEKLEHQPNQISTRKIHVIHES